MKIVYFDCFSGISGDMTLASLIDAGANKDYIESELKKLPIEPFSLEIHQVLKKGISASKLEIQTDSTITPFRRTYTDIVDMIKNSGLSEAVKARSIKIFENIGIAEAKIHNISIQKVHFHEIGAIDSIIDIIGVSLALEDLKIEQIYSTQIPLGAGKIKIEHGIYPNPAPATLEILKGVPVYFSKINSEMTTPTGASIIASLTTDFSLPSMVIESIGYGAGTKDLHDRPNVLRAIIGKVQDFSYKESHFQIHEHHHTHEEIHPHITK
ncbi:MAG: nickel pincer cofactor biosynthesis protein LarC [Vulcanibacillus sp.]